MSANFSAFLIHWAITALSLWIASHIFSGLKFSSTGALVVSALLLGFANAKTLFEVELDLKRSSHAQDSLS